MLFEILYVLVAALLALYGLNALVLTLLSLHDTAAAPEFQVEADFEWPDVTVQLPVYNERYVVQRLIEAISRLDYPRDRFQIQVLDDSTDDTSRIVAREIAIQRAHGLDIEHVRRSNRQGFKGGALAHGLKFAKGDFIAIFDADFLPQADVLRKIIPQFYTDASIGCVQTRWGHLNAGSSWLTRAQSAGIDGHFMVEQKARSANRLFMNFNGTAGIWRRIALDDAGGWQSDTLTEDLDLSYRAQLRGWQIRYLPQVIVPGELPDNIRAYKQQQSRWAKGSLQTARKLLGSLWHSSQPIYIKSAGTLHLTNYLVHPLILINLLLTLPISRSNSSLIRLIPFLTIAGVGTGLMYWVAMYKDGKRFGERIAHLFVLLLLGLGLSLNNSRAVFEALLGVQTAFQRTPKYNLIGYQKQPNQIAYALRRDVFVWVEALLGLYAFGLMLYVLASGRWNLALWLITYSLGLIYIAGMSFLQSLWVILARQFMQRRALEELELSVPLEINIGGELHPRGEIGD